MTVHAPAGTVNPHAPFEPANQGPPGPPGEGFNWRGTWNAGTTYAKNEGVERNGSSFVSVVNGNIGHDPSTDGEVHWNLIAREGKEGKPGAEGPEGKEGKAGAAGQGVPEGGAINTTLNKKSGANYDTQFTLITDANVDAAANIADSKLALTTVVKLTGNQTISGTKTFTTAISVAIIEGLELLKVLGNPGVAELRRLLPVQEAVREFGAGAIAITTAEDATLNLKPTAEGAEVTRVQFASAQPKTGEILLMFNNSAFKLTIVHESAEAGNGKFALVGLANFVIPPKGVKMFQYVGGRWRDFS